MATRSTPVPGRPEHRLRPGAAIVAAALAIAAWVSTGTAQSPNAFGIPSGDQPTPGAAIKAVPGSRAQGWLGQGRSEVIARHGIVATSDPLAAQAHGRTIRIRNGDHPLGDLPGLVSVSSGRPPSGTMPPLRDTSATKALIVTVAYEGLVERVAHKV